MATQIAMPNVIGAQLDTGIEELQAAGVYAPPKLSLFSTFPISAAWVTSPLEPGTITAQLPQPNTPVTPNSAIILAVSRFPVGVSFPTSQTVPPPYNESGAWTADSTSPTIDTTGTTVDE
jgi:beta-lactam-binding protein with PASTA domain